METLNMTPAPVMDNQVAPVADKRKRGRPVTKVKGPNPSVDYFGLKEVCDSGSIMLYPRKGKQWAIKAAGIQITGANFTGRRLHVDFLDENGNVIQTRRVYREWVDTMLSYIDKKNRS